MTAINDATSDARNTAPMVTDPEQVKAMDWAIPGVEYDDTDHELDFKITRAFEAVNNVILDGDALQYFRSKIVETYSPK